MRDMNLGEALTFLGNLNGPALTVLNGYICCGGTVTYNGRTAVAGMGFELVWDIWNEQFSAFYFPIGGLSLAKKLSGTASLYLGVGWAFGDSFPVFPNVHQAWSGRFNSVSASAPIPGFNWGAIGLSAGLSFFASPDFSIRGGAITVSLAGGIPIPVAGELPLGLTGATSVYYPWEAATQALRMGNPAHTLAGKSIIGLERGVLGVALHMTACGISTSPLLGAYATAVSLVKTRAHGQLREATQMMARS